MRGTGALAYRIVLGHGCTAVRRVIFQRGIHYAFSTSQSGIIKRQDQVRFGGAALHWDDHASELRFGGRGTLDH